MLVVVHVVSLEYVEMMEGHGNAEGRGGVRECAGAGKRGYEGMGRHANALRHGDAGDIVLGVLLGMRLIKECGWWGRRVDGKRWIRLGAGRHGIDWRRWVARKRERARRH